MAIGYTRQSTFSDGDTITAALFNNEYNQILNSFAYNTSDGSSGHRHDGTAAQGGAVPLIGDLDFLNKVAVDTSNNRIGVFVEVSSAAVEQVRFQDGAIVPVTDSDIDLGTSTSEFKDLYIDGTANIDSLTLASGATATSIVDEDDMASDSATALSTQQSIKAYVDAQLTASDLDFQGDSGGALSIDLDSETLDIAGGTGIDTTGSSNTLTVAIDSTVATLAGSQTLTNKTLTSPVLGTGVSGSAVLDEDDLSSDSATKLATQQSIKAYVDTQVGASSSTTATFANMDVTTSLQIPDGTTGARPSSPTVGNFRYNTTEGEFEGYGASGWGAIGGGEATFTLDTMTGDGSDTTLTMSVTPATENGIQVYIDGVYQHKDTFSFSGTTLTFSTAPPDGSKVEVINISTVASSTTPGDGTVSSAKLATNLDLTGVMTASTFEPDGDTASGDNAAIGYTSAEGLILTGQGSSTDVTVKNDADTTVMSIATGTTQATFAGEVVAASLDISGNIDVDGTTNLDAVDIDGVVQIDNTVTVGLDDTGYDVKLFGDNAGAYLLWDTSANKLLTAGDAVIDVVKDKLMIGGTAVETTAAELNILDGVTASTAELNKLASAGTLAQAGKQTIWVPAGAMYATTTNGCSDLQQVETTAQKPELKCLDFDASTAEYAQFAIAFPKSWDLGVVQFQAFWSPSTTNAGNAIIGLQGVACTEDDTIDATFGTAVEVTDTAIGTVEDVQMTAVSGDMTIAGSPADDDMCFFQVYRDAADGSDTFTGEVRLLGIKLFFTTDAANDA